MTNLQGPVFLNNCILLKVFDTVQGVNFSSSQVFVLSANSVKKMTLLTKSYGRHFRGLKSTSNLLRSYLESAHVEFKACVSDMSLCILLTVSKCLLTHWWFTKLWKPNSLLQIWQDHTFSLFSLPTNFFKPSRPIRGKHCGRDACTSVVRILQEGYSLPTEPAFLRTP